MSGDPRQSDPTERRQVTSKDVDESDRKPNTDGKIVTPQEFYRRMVARDDVREFLARLAKR